MKKASSNAKILKKFKKKLLCPQHWLVARETIFIFGQDDNLLTHPKKRYKLIEKSCDRFTDDFIFVFKSCSQTYKIFETL